MPEEIHPHALKASVGVGGPPALRQRVALRALHRGSAMVLALFVVVHLLGHLAGLAGAAAHQSVLEALRWVYRQPVVEALLLSCVLFQAGSGLVLLWRGRGRRRGTVARLQALSGGYLALFLAIHTGAVFQARAQGLDTNLHFAAAGMQVQPWPWFFVPYYFLAVWAFWTHVGCALYWNLPPTVRTKALVLALCLGVLWGACLVALLAGGFHALEIPAHYLAPLAALAGRG